MKVNRRRSHHKCEQHGRDIGLDERRSSEQRHDAEEEHAQTVLKARPKRNGLLFAAEAVRSRAADEKAQRAGEDERRELKDAVRQDTDEIDAEPKPLRKIQRGERAEHQRVGAERERAERQKRDEPVEHREERRDDVVEKQRRHHLRLRHIIGEPKLLDLHGETVEHALRKLRLDERNSKAQQREHAERGGGVPKFVPEQAARKRGAVAVDHESLAIPALTRLTVSSRPRMWQISTAPPGVTSLPATAMRSGHMSVAFFTPSSSANETSISWMASFVHVGSVSSLGSTF